jgi:hypothetical protein
MTRGFAPDQRLLIRTSAAGLQFLVMLSEDQVAGQRRDLRQMKDWRINGWF